MSLSYKMPRNSDKALHKAKVEGEQKWLSRIQSKWLSTRVRRNRTELPKEHQHLHDPVLQDAQANGGHSSLSEDQLCG